MQRSFSSVIRLIGLIALTGLITSPVMADEVSHSEARTLRESGKILPLETIIETAKTYRTVK